MSAVETAKVVLRGRWFDNQAGQSGFGLIELMVAMVISLLLLGAVLKLFLDVTRTNDDMARTNMQIENARFAIQTIGHDLVHAGFWDGYVPEYDDLTADDIPAGYPVSFIPPAPCEPYAAWTNEYRNNLLRMPLQAFADTPSGCGNVIQNKKANTDVLVVNFASTATTAPAVAGSDDRIYFQSSRCESEDKYAFVLAATGFNLTGLNCTQLAPVRQLITHIYFVNSSNTLMRAERISSTAGSEWNVQPMIDGVEFMIAELGVDDRRPAPGGVVDYKAAIDWSDPLKLKKVLPRNRGDGAPDTYLRCGATGCTMDQLINVVSAKLYFVVRSTEPSRGFVDAKQYTLGGGFTFTPAAGEEQSFKRHLYTSAVRLNNVSSRRETP